MGAVILLRHGRSTSNSAGVLSGRAPGVGLDSTGADQAAALPARLAGCPVTRLVSSPMRRCRESLAPLAAALDLRPIVDDRLTEVDYGDWTGCRLTDLAGQPLWPVVQQRPSTVVFPGGEALADAAARGRQSAREVGGATSAGQVTVMCTHGDIIKAIVADALGMPLDSFQRLMVSPASISVVHYHEQPQHSAVEKLNVCGTLGPIGIDDGADRAGATIGGESGQNASQGA